MEGVQWALCPSTHSPLRTVAGGAAEQVTDEPGY